MTELRVTTLGTGTAMPDAERGPSAYLLAYDGATILFDVGDGTLQKLHQAGGHILTLDALVISHAHFDHLAGLFPLLFALHVPAFERTRPLHIYLSEPTYEYVKGAQGVFGSWLQPSAERVVFHPLRPGDLVEIAGLRAETRAVCHDASSLGYRFTAPTGQIVAIPADTGPCDTLVPLCQDAHLAILECGVPDALANDMHLAPSEIIALATEARPDRILIVHRYAAAHQANVTAQIDQALPIPVVAPRDGDTFTLPPRTDGET